MCVCFVRWGECCRIFETQRGKNEDSHSSKIVTLEWQQHWSCCRYLHESVCLVLYLSRYESFKLYYAHSIHCLHFALPFVQRTQNCNFFLIHIHTHRTEHFLVIAKKRESALAFALVQCIFGSDITKLEAQRKKGANEQLSIHFLWSIISSVNTRERKQVVKKTTSTNAKS